MKNPSLGYSLRWNILWNFMLLEINVKNHPELLPHRAIAAEKITFSTHNTLCFFHKFYIRISISVETGSASVFFAKQKWSTLTIWQKGKFINITVVTCFTLCLWQKQRYIQNVISFRSSREDRWVRSFWTVTHAKGKMISLICFNRKLNGWKREMRENV